MPGLTVEAFEVFRSSGLDARARVTVSVVRRF
jgi:hypothetical protein